MAINQIPSQRTWVDGQPFSARDYIYERNLVISKVNEIIVDVNNLTSIFDTGAELGDNFLDARYYTESELNAGQLDNRYYTEAEVNGLFVTEQNRLNRLESKFDATILAENDQLFDQAVNTDSAVEFASVKLGANVVNEAFIDGLENKYTTAQVDAALALKIDATEKGAANGVATLDGDGRLPVGQLPLNTVVFRGTFGDGVGDLPTTGVETGDFYICVSNGYVSAVAGQTFDTGDKAVYDGTNWSKIDNTETVTSVNGAVGAVVLDYDDVGAAAASHTHLETDITDLDKYTQSEVNQLLAGKSDTGHTHLEIDITDLDKYTQSEVDGFLANKSDTGHTHTESDITDLDKYTQTEVDNLLANKVNTSALGVTVATLVGGTVPANQLPSFVDDVLEYADFASFPATGNSGKIYLAQDTGRIYRWGATQYVEIAANSVLSVNGYTDTVVLTDADIAVDASGFTGVLDTDDTDVETALATIDAHTHTYADITAKPDFYTEAEMDALLAEKADVADLSASITLYPTTTPSAVSGYFTMVEEITDERYNDVAFDVGTGAISTTNQLIASLATDTNIFTGNPGVINVTTIGNIRKTSGNSNQYAEFFYRIYQRKSDGTENLLGTSDTTGAVNPENGSYYEFSASAVLNNGTFEATDRLVIKYYANAMEGTVAEYDFQFGGTNPVRTFLPVPVRVLQSAEKIVYDNTTSGLTATDLQAAVDELDQLIAENTSVLKIQRFVITNADNGDGTFSYTWDGNARTGTLTGGQYQFDLEDSVEYIVGQNRLEIKVNNNLSFYPNDTEIEEIDTDTVGITYSLQANDEVFIKVYQGLDSVALVVPDGSVTTAKLSQGLQNDLTSYDNHIASTANPHGVTKTQIGLPNVTNDAQVKKAASSTDGHIPKWSGTAGDAIVDGYGVQTTLSSSTSDLVRADAIATAVNAKQDTLVSGTNIKTLNGSTLLGSGDYVIDIPSVEIASTAPANPNVGDLWWNDNNGVLYIYYNDGTSSQWVSVSYADVQEQLGQLIGNAPETLDTLAELADAINDDAQFVLNLNTNKADKLATLETISANHTLVLADANKVLECTNSAAITITIPANATISFPVGTQIAVIRNGAGTVTFAGASGVTVNSKDSALAIAGQYASAALLKIDTDEWQLVGSLE